MIFIHSLRRRSHAKCLRQMDILIFSLLLLLLLVTSTGVSGVTTLTLVNSCDNTIWPGIRSTSGSLNTTGFELPRKASRTFQAPTGWNGQFWGRTGCKVNESGSFECQTGDCGSGSVECNDAGGVQPVTLSSLVSTSSTAWTNMTSASSTGSTCM